MLAALRSADLSPGEWLTPSDLALILRSAYDPAVAGALERQGDIDPWDGVKLRYVNPATGGWAMSTIGTFMQLLPRGFSGKTSRATDATVYSVVEGRGRAIIDGQVFAFEPRDTFVVPSWAAVSLQADEECVLFSYSDRPVQEALGLVREARDNH